MKMMSLMFDEHINNLQSSFMIKLLGMVLLVITICKAAAKINQQTQ